MLCFSLGTVPLMLGFGSFFSALGKKFTRQILKIGAVLVVVMGLSMMAQGSEIHISYDFLKNSSEIFENWKGAYQS